MTLEEIRADIIEYSGDANLADNTTRLDSFITAALRELSQICRTPVDRRITTEALATDANYVTIANLRAPRDILNAGEPLVRKTLEELLKLYPDIDNEDSGTPGYWAVDAGVVTNGERSSSTNIRIMPPADEDYTLTVLGDFFDAFNTDDNGDIPTTATCWWSVNYPNVLVMMAMSILERSYGNDEREQYWRQKVNESALRICGETAAVENDIPDYL